VHLNNHKKPISKQILKEIFKNRNFWWCCTQSQNIHPNKQITIHNEWKYKEKMKN